MYFVCFLVSWPFIAISKINCNFGIFLFIVKIMRRWTASFFFAVLFYEEQIAHFAFCCHAHISICYWVRIELSAGSWCDQDTVILTLVNLESSEELGVCKYAGSCKCDCGWRLHSIGWAGGEGGPWRRKHLIFLRGGEERPHDPQVLSWLSQSY